MCKKRIFAHIDSLKQSSVALEKENVVVEVTRDKGVEKCDV